MCIYVYTPMYYIIHVMKSTVTARTASCGTRSNQSAMHVDTRCTVINIYTKQTTIH